MGKVLVSLSQMWNCSHMLSPCGLGVPENLGSIPTIHADNFQPSPSGGRLPTCCPDLHSAFTSAISFKWSTEGQHGYAADAVCVQVAGAQADLAGLAHVAALLPPGHFLHRFSALKWELCRSAMSLSRPSIARMEGGPWVGRSTYQPGL